MQGTTMLSGTPFSGERRVDVKVRYDIDYIDAAGHAQTTSAVVYPSNVLVRNGFVQFLGPDDTMMINTDRVVMITASRWEPMEEQR